jgi:hypothetical protein
MNTNLRTLFFLTAGILTTFPAHASVERELKKMTGYTIIHGGYIKDRIEKNYTEKYLQLDNGWLFKLNCLMLMPLNMTDVIVFGKSYPEEVLKAVPNLPKHLQYEFKLLIGREVCDATLTQ